MSVREDFFPKPHPYTIWPFLGKLIFNSPLHWGTQAAPRKVKTFFMVLPRVYDFQIIFLIGRRGRFVTFIVIVRGSSPPKKIVEMFGFLRIIVRLFESCVKNYCENLMGYGFTTISPSLIYS